MMKKFCSILCFLLAIQTVAQAQKVSNKGTDFWAGFGHVGVMEIAAWLDTPRTAFSFSAEQAAKVVVTIAGTTYRREYNVPANSVVRSENMPQGFRDIPASPYDAMLYSKTSNWPGGTNSEGIFKQKAIHIQSDVPIVVHEIQYAPFSAAATMLIPVDSWGYSYKVLSHDQQVTNFASLGRFAWVFVVANYDNTRIQINPTNATRSGLPANTPINVTLQKGEIYQIQANVPPGNLTGTNDFIGSTIKSVANSDGVCYPVAAFVGSSGGYVHCGSFPGNWPSEDMFIQQMFPVEAWGRRYLATPSSRSDDLSGAHNNNFFRIIPKVAGTVVKRNGVPLTILPKGYYEFQTNTADYIEANEPIQVAQIFPTQGTCGYVGEGDPEMLFLSPIEQGIKKVAFQRIAFPGWENKGLVVNWNLMTLNIPTAGLASLTIDGIKNNFTRSYPNPNLPGYSVVVRLWNTRSNTDARAPTTCVVESDSAFTGITYGLSSALSYGFNIGTYINNLSGFPFIKNKYNTSDTASPYTCGKTPVELSVLLRYKPSKILWQLSKLADTILPAADVTMNAPVSVGEVLVEGIPYYRYNLPGTYVFNRPGLYDIPVFATAPNVEQCDNTERIPYQVEVRDTMQTAFSMLYENCKASELVQFSGRAKFTDSSLVKRWEWTFKNGATTATANGQNVSYTFNAGNNSANLIAVDHVGCIADTTKTFILANKPATPAFSVTSTANCVNSAIRFAENNPQSGAQSWFWNFGNGDTSTVFANGHTVNHVYKANDTLTVKHMVKFGNNCYSDTAVQTVIIYANPVLDITYHVGCLPADSIVKFTSKVTTPENQTVSTYLWNFGDANATPANPNTAAIANPSHKYAAGDYKVSLSATTSKGCVGDSTWDIKLLPVPDVKYGPVLTPVCFNTASPVSIATATITNGVAGTGIYKGIGTDSKGDFNPSVAGVGNHTIWYVFTGSNGCSDSAAASIWVHTVPSAAFTATADVCLDKDATFTDQSTINNTVDVNAKIQSWTWNFGDGTADVIKTTGQPFNRKFTDSKAYIVSLKTTSADGCVSSIVTDTVNVHALPVADFILPTNICMPGGQAVFTSKSSGADTSALTYLWNFGDGGTSTAVNGSHTYNSAKAYTVSLKATSGFGCSATSSQVLPAAAFKSKPATPDFSIPSSANCVNNNIIFAEKVPQAGAQSWFWDFGNGDTSTVFANGQTANHVYKVNDTLTVKHMVKFNDDCYSDTAIQTVIVYANPVLDITYPIGCLPIDGIIKFTSQVTTPEKQTVSAYLWNFGDPSATPANPNTSTIANPSHKYAAGNYKVTLKATTSKGCVGDSSWDISLQPRPVIAYSPVLSPVCFNTAAPVSVASASITNGVAGTGIYKGAGTTSNGNFNPSVAGVGNHAIWYVFNSDGGCKDSAATSIWVYAVPASAFTAPADICLDQSATFTDQSTINNTVDVNAKIQSWTWNFGDGNADVVYANGQPFQKTFNSSKAYTVSLKTTSADGCVSNLVTKTLNVHALPVVDFSLPTNICMPGGQALFTNKSSVAGQSQLSYSWNFGDGTTATDVNATHTYASSQSYTVSLKATSSFGCATDTTKILDASAFKDKPVASITVSNDRPCEQSVVNFTDQSTPADNIASWDWSFGDGTKDNRQNPSKTYTKFGPYTISLVVVDKNGCRSEAGTTSSKTVNVLIKPVIDAGPHLTAEENTTVTLKATASNASELLFSWSPAGVLNNATILNPSYVVKQSQVFILTASDKGGTCVATDEMKVTILRAVTVPNAFSPNGDGINDVWVIQNLADYPNASVKVFDRYGKLVYTSQGYSRPWDGTQNGRPLPVGTYYYIIQVKQGETPLNGSVTIIR
jgi:gliding motility-associated-like protein